ncbi:MAG: hypothetical protein JWM12_3806 [Ilumatobacteraceae bacterium]|nr:hypothetical protein [Ilumatobacteraceae bacterium]
MPEPVADPALDELIHRADLDGLVRLIDAECTTGDWDRLLQLRNRARDAVDTGRQLWPAATLAEYRLALWAPAAWAAAVLDEDSGRFTIGPLTEVAAVHHTFADLAAHVPAGPRLGFIAHERALRGESISVADLEARGVPDVLDIPLSPQPWEPRYGLATYTNDGLTADPPPRPTLRSRAASGPTSPAVRSAPAAAAAAAAASVREPAAAAEPSPALAADRGGDVPRSQPFAEPPRDDSRSADPADGDERIVPAARPEPAPPTATNRHVEDRQRAADSSTSPATNRHVEDRQGTTGGMAAAHGGPAAVVDDDAVELATRQLLEAWTASSNGRAEVVCVEGTAAAAVAALGVREARLVPLEPAEALAWLAWAGACGGAHGRRRGAAIGRFGAWWMVAALGDALEDWPLSPDDVGDIAADLSWYWWDAGEPPLGWELQLAVEDSAEGYAWAISAHDAD